MTFDEITAAYVAERRAIGLKCVKDAAVMGGIAALHRKLGCPDEELSKQLVEQWIGKRPGELEMTRLHRVSANTVASYRDAFKLLIDYLGEMGKESEPLAMPDLGRDAVEGFLGWLVDRGCSDSTVNQRLCAVKAFVGFVKGEDPARLLQYQQVLAIKRRKKKAPKMAVPGRDGLAAMLRNPDFATAKGRRDTVLFTVLYDSAARVSELCGLVLRDLRLDDPAVVTPRGKCIAFLVTPGSPALSPIFSLNPSNALGLSRLRSSISSPPFQYLATVCLFSPRFFPICVKLGFTPSCRYVFSSPMMLLSNRALSD